MSLPPVSSLPPSPSHTHRLNDPTVRIAVLGDTSYGSTCVDEVAAQHIGADVIVHYGPASVAPCVCWRWR